MSPARKQLIGGSGSNTFVFNNGASFAGTINGGVGGTNTLNYSAYTTAVTVNLTAGTATGTTGFSDIGNVIGGSGTNTFAFGSTSPTQDDTWGADTVSGAGSNILDFSAISSDTDLTFDIHADGTVSATDNGTNTLGDIANVTQITGGAGSNNYIFDDGGHFTGAINGGSGTSNTIDYSAYTTGVTVNLQTGTATGTTGISNIQNIYGGSGDDTLTAGSTGANVIVGGGGDDTITAGQGNDTLSDGGGNDTYKFSNNWGTGTTVTNTGATGTQTLDFSGVSSSLTVTINTDGTVSVSDALGDSLTNVANMQGVIGGTGANTFSFQNQASFDGTLTGTGTNNTLDYSLYASAVEVNLDPAVAIATGTMGVSNIQNATGGKGDNTLIGNSQNNILTGGPANNMFTGGGGTDTIIGNTTGTNTIVETWDASGMTLAGTVAGSTLIVSNGGVTVGTDNLTNIQAAILTGGLHSTTVDASGFAGSVTLDAGSQVLLSALDNGSGVHTTDATEPNLTGSTLLSTLNDGSGVHFAGNGVNDFRITLTDGSSFNVSLYGATTLQNVFDRITGAGPAGRVSVGVDTQQGDSIVITDSLDAGGSVSVTSLNGTTASDLGIAGTGNGDTVIGSSIAEVTADIRVTMTDGTPVDIDLSGLDTVRDVLAAFNEADSRLSASIDSAGTGIDVSDAAAGGGNITISDMNGSTAGTDLGIVGTGTGSVLHGTSIVTGTVSSGGGNITLDGRNKVDTLDGGTAANTYTGGGGTTHVVGQGTNNTVVETRGDDSYNFTLSNSTLTITDNTSGVAAVDILSNVQHATLTAGNGNNTTMDASAFTAGSVILTVGDGNSDTLKGGSGDDTLYAGDGANDSLNGGSGNNTLTVGAGAGDTINGGSPTGTNTLLEVGDHRYVLTNTTLDMGRGTDEVENVALTGTVTGGVFTLTYGGQTTIAIPYNASAGVVQADLMALSNIGSGDVSVASNSSGTWSVTFTGNLAGLPESITTDGTGLTGTGANVGVTEGTHGALQQLDSISNIRNVEFSAILAGVLMDTSQFSTTGTVTLSGGEGVNTFKAGSGTTVMTGGPEDNTFYGGTGNDTITGNATGTNTLIETHDANMTLTNTSLTVAGGKTDTLSGIQNVELTGGAGADTLDATGFNGVYADTELQSINNGSGIGTTSGPDIKITLTDGSSKSIDLASAFTIQDVLDAIHSADSRLTATLGSSGAITVSDTAAGSGNLAVANCTGSTAATDLGIAGTGSGASFTGSPMVCGSVTFYGSAGSGTMKGGTGSTNSLVETYDANMTLTGTVASSSLAVSGAVNKTDTLKNIANITLTDSGTALGTQRTLDAHSFTGSVTLVASRADTLKGGRAAATCSISTFPALPDRRSRLTPAVGPTTAWSSKGRTPSVPRA